MDEQTSNFDQRFSRIARMIGEQGLNRLKASHVTIIGLGAVGSYAVESLARAGVGKLRLVDFDEIQTSNINRQLYALESTLGMPKCEAARRRVLEINPRCQVEAMNLFVHKETMDQVLAGPPDLVIDAIDSLTPKVELLANLVQRNIPMISSMGAALRTDPTQVRIGPLSQTRQCPLARKVRKGLMRRGISTDFPCVYSVEPLTDFPFNAIAIAPEDESDDPFLDRGRKRRTLGSLPTLTGIFGLTAANTALQMLLKEADPSNATS
jgi:tRNA A37 threonylcarbamoyladenosine dehydratase